MANSDSEVRKGFLVRGDAAESAAQAENLNTLLLSDDPASVETALELIKKGGVPEAVFTGLFVVARFGGDARTRARARRVLRRRAPESVNALLTERVELRFEGRKAESRTVEALERCAGVCEVIDWPVIARYIHGRTGHGLSWIFTSGAAVELELEILRERIDEGHLDFRSVFRPGSPPAYNIPNNRYSPRRFPQSLLELTELTSLDLSGCLFDTVPDGIARLKNLQHLELSGNMLQTLPGTLVELEQLRHLGINGNVLVGFPEVLRSMPWLSRVELQGNRRESDSHHSRPIVVDERTREAMPQTCFVDGMDDWQQQFSSLFDGEEARTPRSVY